MNRWDINKKEIPSAHSIKFFLEAEKLLDVLVVPG